jgi:hypothetical protein
MLEQTELSPARARVHLGVTVALIVGVSALLARVGADARWLGALGHAITTGGGIPSGVPFASAPTGHWPNVLVLAELTFNALERLLGDRGLMLAQLAACAAAMWILARDAMAGDAGPVGTSTALLVAALGALPSLAIARVQLFSLILFPILLSLLRAQTRRPSRSIWLAVPLLALWSNLHGAALLGEAVLFAYLLLFRARRQPYLSAAVAIAALAALCLTPAGTGSIDYYHGLLTNLAAQRGDGMWAPLALSNPADLIMLGCGGLLALRARRTRIPLWELVVLAALAGLTLHASRNGVWLLFFAIAPAARGSAPVRAWSGLVPMAALASVALVAVAVIRGPAHADASPALVAHALMIAHGSPVLAEGGLAEQFVQAGGTISVGNPLDAFARSDQTAYLDWMGGRPDGRRALGPAVRVVLVLRGGDAQRLMARTPGFSSIDIAPSVQIFQRDG